ncbi:MAG: hypothetical protein LBH19_15360 [Dysgonamonadaceae bacterium]|jgi:hypothetical protein|nr:hypothetical protein [Dysgonamonadaceae bacterium]
MKTHFLSLLLIFAASPAMADANDDKPVKTLLFLQFEKGYVVLKEGYVKLSAQLNYDLLEERMLYLEADSLLNELDASAVMLVVINGRSFFPAKNKAFYERIETGASEYYICHKTKMSSQGKSTGYGAYSQTASVGGIAVATAAGNLYLLGPEEKSEGIDDSSIHIKKGKKFEKINSLKNLLKCFKSHQPEIEAYAEENKTDFNRLENVKNIVEYALSLEKDGKSL